MHFIDQSALEHFSADAFSKTAPFPHQLFNSLLTPAAFDLLYREFPALSLFEKHVDIPRSSGQRPHNRYYLAFERSIYNHRSAGSEGVAAVDGLPLVWQQFLDYVQNDAAYRKFLVQALGTEEYELRFAWHIGEAGSEVSPHRDSHSKLGTHIFYFNTTADWETEWGGSMVVLGGKRVSANNPEVADFDETHSFDIRDNRSFLFKNTDHAWHGVQALKCPLGHYRRLFNVIVETPVRARTNRSFWQWPFFGRKKATALQM